MPRIPRFLSTELPAVPQGRIGAALVVPQATAELGEQGQRVAALLARFQIARNEVANSIEARTREAEFETELQGRILELENQPDPHRHTESVASAAQEIAQRHISESTNPAIADRLTATLTELTLARVRDARRFENNVLQQHGRAAILHQLEIRQRAAADVIDPRDAETELQGALDALAEAQRLGLWNADQIVVMEQAFRKNVRISRAQQAAHRNPDAFLAAIDGPEFSDLTADERLRLKDVAEAEQAQRERILAKQQAQARSEENIELFRKLKTDTLTVEEVLKSQFLSREDMNFFTEALTRTRDPETDPATWLALDELLVSDAMTPDQRVSNARQAKTLAQQAYLEGKRLSKEDARRIIERANKAIQGEEPEEDRWFKTAKRYLADRLGGTIVTMPDGRITVSFLDPAAVPVYWRLVTELMVAQEDQGLQGRALFERAVALMEGEGASFWIDRLSRPADSGEALADPINRQKTQKGQTPEEEAEQFLKRRRAKPKSLPMLPEVTVTP